MSQLTANVRLFVVYAWYAHRALYSWLSPSTYLILKILAPLTQVIFFTLLGTALGGDASYYVIGNATQLTAVSGIFGMMQVIMNERRTGTLSHLILAPTSNALTFYARSVLVIVDSLSSIVVGFGAGALLFGLDFGAVNWLWLAIALLITGFAVSALGLTAGMLGLIGTDVNLLLNLLMSALLVLCGANFPVSALPPALRLVSAILPLTHGLAAVRAIFTGDLEPVPRLLAQEMLIGGVYMLIGYMIYRFVEYFARAHALFDLQ